jgi:peptidyl-prolyl cis-trans isomerase A (cyclophilin A)
MPRPLDSAGTAPHNADAASAAPRSDQERSVPNSNPPVSVVIATPLGEIEVELDLQRAPVTTSNFLHYVDGGFYSGGRFHRTVTPENQSNANLKEEKIGAGIDPAADRAQLPNDAVTIEVIQGGVDPARQGELGPPIPLERTSDTGLRHGDGAISMARLTADSAVSDFFICIGDQPELDYGGKRNPDGQGFAAFGSVTRGMDVVHAIQRSPADGQSLDPPVAIVTITRLA